MGFFGFNFGLEGYIGLAVYLAAILAFLLSVAWRPLAGICFLAPLIPLQTIRARLEGFPLGGSLVGILLLGVALGLLRRRRPIFTKNPWSRVLCVYALFTLTSLLLGQGHYGERLAEWKDFMLMPLLLFLTAAATKDIRQMKVLLLLMCLAVFLMDRSFWNAISERDFSTFSRDLQEGGAMGYAGVQGLSAFNAQFAWFLVALAGCQPRRALRWACLSLALFAANCVMYSFSRGAYVAFLTGWLFIGLVKERKLLVILVLFLASWASLVPGAVKDRVLMTYDADAGEMDHAAAVRLVLWAEAMDLFQTNPALGTGFNTYAHMQHPYDYADTHNIYLKVLVETGILGLLLFLYLLARTFYIGFCLFRSATEPLFRALGLGLAAWVLCVAAASLFGDRWTYLQINGYLWMLAGFVSRAMELEAAREQETAEAASATAETAVPAMAGV